VPVPLVGCAVCMSYLRQGCVTVPLYIRIGLVSAGATGWVMCLSLRKDAVSVSTGLITYLCLRTDYVSVPEERLCVCTTGWVVRLYHWLGCICTSGSV